MHLQIDGAVTYYGPQKGGKMSKMRNYEISLWRDIFNNGEVFEQKMYVFGSDELLTQSRAFNVNFKRKVNGSNELTFKMYYQYIDSITGKKVENPYVQDLINEAKIKLKFKNKWYDLIIKNTQKDSNNHTISFTASDLHINELSKNGFGLTISTELENSIGTAEELAEIIFSDTDWEVDASEKIPQTTEESLIEIRLTQDLSIKATQLKNSGSIAPVEQEVNLFIPKEEKVYLFYSCCKGKTNRFQFIYVPSSQQISKNQDRVITNEDSQYYIDNTIYVSNDLTSKYGLEIPRFFQVSSFTISENYRGSRYVYSAKTLYNRLLNRYVTEYKDSFGETVHVFSDTEYITPNIIQNYITNNTFQSTSGWTGAYVITNQNQAENFFNQTLKWGANCFVDTTPKLLNDLMVGSFDGTKTYKPYLGASFPISDNTEAILVNSSFYDTPPSPQLFSKGKKFILFYNQMSLEYDIKPKFIVKVGEVFYDTTKGCYNNKFNHLFLTFDSTNAKPYAGTVNGVSGYNYIEAVIPNNISFSEKELSRLKIQTFIAPKNKIEGQDLKFLDLQIFPYYEKEDGGFVLPADPIEEAQAITNYSYFYPDSEENKKALSAEEMIIYQTQNEPIGLQVVYNTGAEKINTLSVAKSNYFNACQKLCEVFECWADFDIEHDQEGYITKKTVRIKNYIGKENHGGFRYGVNLNTISRKDDSQKIVTKLLVTDNSNEFAKDGFCTIQRAASNETGENYIYDFSYYVNKGLIDRTALSNILYNTDGGCGPDLILVRESHEGINKPLNCQGYYTRLSLLNKEMDRVSAAMLDFSVPKMQAEANLAVYEAGVIAADSELESNISSFRQMTGFEYTQIVASESEGFSPIEIADETKRRRALVENNVTISSYLTKISELLPTKQEFETKKTLAQAAVTQYNAALQNLELEYNRYFNWKKELNKLFFRKFYRYIQEGTWSDESQTDDEKYYIDALSVGYNSSMPQVTYTFKVTSLENLEEGFAFDLGDKTFIEDEEYFGYDEYGNPYREEVVITEIVYVLDEVDKDSISIKNYKNQFQDLFQSITASVQTVNYTSGAWDKAATFTESTDKEKSKFLQGALNYADTVLTNAGEQSVVWDRTGITITDKTKPNQQIRMVAGGIFLRDKNDDGLNWKVGITSEGINAKLITAGQINTGLIQIMRGDEPYFRWDDHGITAYSFDENIKRITTSFDTKRGVRFDRFGVYGYDMNDESFISETEIKDGQTWHPVSIDEVRSNSVFSLTWDGLQLKPGAGYYGANGKTYHASYAFIGKTDGKLYNGWDNWYTPITNSIDENQTQPFVKIISAGTKEGTNFTETLAIYDNGVLVCQDARLRGTIYAESGRIGSEKAGWKIDANSITTGTLGTDGFHMFASGVQEESVGVGEFEDRDDWRLFIGQSFGVDSDGRLYANEANISGIITALAGGNIGGWEIGENYLISENAIGTNDSFHMYSKDKSPKKKIGNSSELENWRLVIGSNFGVDATGTLYAADANITGNISIGKGATIAGWTVGTNCLTYGKLLDDNSIHLYNLFPDEEVTIAGHKDNSWRIVVGDNFGVTKGGNLYATGGQVGKWNITEKALVQEYLYILAEDEIDYYSQKTGLETECIFQSYDDSRTIPSWQGVGIYQGELFIKTPEDYNQNPVLLSFESRFNPGVQYRVIWNRDDDKLEVVMMGTHQFKELMEKMKPPVQPPIKI